MGSNMEPVPVNSQKHDPAWKHCQMFKNGDRIHLKCIYCGKIFKGGGIHRIKEHLAGQKGNAATCLRVQPDVRLLMLESLNGVVVKKRKKQKLAEEITNYNNNNSNDKKISSATTDVTEVDNGNPNSNLGMDDNRCCLNTEVVVEDLLPVHLATFEENGNVFVSGEEVGASGDKFGGRKKKGKIRKAFVGGGYVSPNLSASSKKVNSYVHMAIGRFLFDVGLPLDAVNSTYFQPMLDAIAAQGARVVGPSYHDLRGCILKNMVQDVRNDVDRCTGTWGNSGCSILVDEWITAKGKTSINFLAYSSEGTIFLRSVDASDIIGSVDALYEVIREVLEEVGVRNVLQVITSSDERYAVVGKRVADSYPTVFWIPCAASVINLMLEDIGDLEWVNTVLEQAKSISRFIYNHAAILNMTRRYTFGVDLVDIGFTRAETDFLTLKRMVSIRHNLQSMVTSEEWMESSYAKKPDGLAILDYISCQSFWSTCTLITRLIDPLLRLLRIVGSGKRPAMGFVYAGLYRAKEVLKKELVSKKEYEVYWKIIDHRWEQLQGYPLHAAGFYLNPKFFYSTQGDARFRIRSLLYDCVEKLVSDPKIQDKIGTEITSYHSGAGDFGRKMAIRARDTLLPDEWWSTYGGCCPNLARLAIRILSQTCSLLRCKPKQLPLELMHETKNCIEHQRLRDHVFVQYNFWLKQTKNKEQGNVDPLTYECSSIVGDWVVVKEVRAEDLSSSDWTIVDPPLGNAMLLGPPIDDVEALGSGFDDYEIFDGVKESDEEISAE